MSKSGGIPGEGSMYARVCQVSVELSLEQENDATFYMIGEIWSITV